LDQILHYLNVPANIYDQARQFLFVFILSVPPIAAVYLVGALLRAAGNSTVTSYAMTVSTILNIGLVLLFVLVFHWSVVGTAVATLIAQCVSAAIILFAFFRSDACRAAPIDWRAQAALAKEIARLWLPMLLNSVIIAIGGNMVQREINALGSEFTAGIAAGTKIFSLLEAVIMALQTGLSVYVGQNLGARRAERVRDGARKLVGASILITLFMVLAVWAFGGTILSWFLSAENEKAYLLAHGAALRFTRVITAGMFIMTPMYLYRMMVQLLGHSEYPVIAGVLQLFARVAMVQLLPRFIGEYAYYMTDVAAWIVSLPVVMIPCMVLIRKLCQKKESLR
jgi:Na+-driven multidrug efflux pump